MSKVMKAVFPVAGMGTRFLPATKAMPPAWAVSRYKSSSTASASDRSHNVIGDIVCRSPMRLVRGELRVESLASLRRHSVGGMTETPKLRRERLSVG